jgi:glucans biosynthesis protein C
MSKAARIYYIDNLRIFLIALVVLHHLSITYGASGGWYYQEVEADTFTSLILTMFTAANQSFFMGFFFLISAYFTKISIEKKRTKDFLKDKFIRLGIPLVIFYFIISPITIYISLFYSQKIEISFIEFIKTQQGFGFGPLWFIETLIYFSLVYAAYKYFSNQKSSGSLKEVTFPKTNAIVLFALAIGAISFTLRLWLPVGWELKGTGLQFPFFPQYIAMLILGILFAKYNWFDSITYKVGLKWFGFAQFSILVLFPLSFYYGAREAGVEPFLGGLKWQAAMYAFWEQLTGIALIIALIGLFKKKFNNQGILAKRLSGAAYAVFIIHPPVIVALALLLKNWDLYPVLKFILVAPIALFLCFGIAILLKQIPGFKRIL